MSTSKDGTCLVWDFVNGTALHTYLLPSGPLCLALDPADRALYVGYEDGTIQLIDFYKQLNSTNSLHDPALQITPSQPPETDRWQPPSDGDASTVVSLDIGYDGTLLVSGHRNGKIHTWDVATGRVQKEILDLSAPVTNLMMLPPTGFHNELQPGVKLHNVIKPHYDSFALGGDRSEAASIPLNYNFTAQFISSISSPGSHVKSSFQDTLMHSSFPSSLLEEGITEFSLARYPSLGHSDSVASEDLRNQNMGLASQLEIALAQQRKAESAIKERDQADWKRIQDEEIKAARKKRRRLSRIKADEELRKKEMGEQGGHSDQEMKDDEEEDLSSSTDEY